MTLEASADEIFSQFNKMNCRVCNNTNCSKHNYYGANFVCASCRGFFMRAVQSGLYKAFNVHSNLGCVIDSKNRKSCRKCRFEKCLSVGMKTSFVKTFGERKDQIQRAHKVLQVGFTSDEGRYIDELSLKFHTDFNIRSFELYAKSIDLVYEHFGMRDGDVMTTEEINKANKMDYAILMDVAQKLLEFDDKISPKERFTLSKRNFHRLQCLCIAVLFEVGKYFLNLLMLIFIYHLRNSHSNIIMSSSDLDRSTGNFQVILSLSWIIWTKSWQIPWRCLTLLMT